jgi:hypothetical protein
MQRLTAALADRYALERHRGKDRHSMPMRHAIGDPHSFNERRSRKTG